MGKTLEIDFKRLIFEVLYKSWIIILIAAVTAVGAYIYAKKNLIPRYTTGASLYLNNYVLPEDKDVVKVGSSDLATSQALVNTYLVLLKSDRALATAAEWLDNDYTPAQLRGMMSASAVEETEIFRINITHTDPYEAQRIANVIADVACTAIPEYREGTSVKVVDYAVLPTMRSYPVYRKYLMMGAGAGGGITAVIIVLLFLFNSKIATEEDIKKLFTAPVIGKIPCFQQRHDPKKNYGYNKYEKKIHISSSKEEKKKEGK